MIRMAICDDDQAIHHQITQWLQAEDLANEDFDVSYYTSGEALLAEDCNQWDMVFLDIQMAGMDGMETARQLRNSNAQVIIVFLTGFAEYMAEGYVVEAFRYLLKPIGQQQWLEVLDKARAKLMDSKAEVTIKHKNEHKLVKVRDIQSIESYLRKVTISTMTESYQDDRNFGYWLALLTPYGFIESHRGILVNKAHIKRYDKKSLTLANSKVLPIARNKLEAFQKKILGAGETL